MGAAPSFTRQSGGREVQLLSGTRERLQRYARNFTGTADAVPVLAQMNEHVPALFGADLHAYYTNAALFVEANLAVYQYYAVDLPGFYYDIYNVEAEALGQRLNWEQDRMPEIDRSRPLIREHSDLDRLRPPDPRRAGRYPFVLEAIKRTYDLGIPMRLRLCSPFTLATNVRGIEQFLVDIYTAPEFAHRLLRFLTDEVLVPWVAAQREAAGRPEVGVTGADAAASPPIASLPVLEEFVFPYVARINDQAGKVSGIGYWGQSCFAGDPARLRRMLEMMASVSPNLLMCVDPDVALTGPEPYAQFAREKGMPLMLGLDTVFLQEGPVEAIVERCRRYVLAGAKAGRLFMFLNDVSVHTPPEHVHAAVAAIHHFGTYPIEDRPLESLQLPVLESFRP
jgi:uroporphyrinogen decarboxylase